MTANRQDRTLLSIIELGGYPNFDALYRRLGYRHATINTGRKAISLLKKDQPDVVVTEFHYQFSFRDRTSSLESILAVAQGNGTTRVIVFYDPEYADQLEKVRQRFPGFEAMPYPIDTVMVEECLRRLTSGDMQES